MYFLFFCHVYLLKFDFLDCGNTLVGGAVTTTDADCNMGCAGNTTYVHNPIYIDIVLSAMSS